MNENVLKGFCCFSYARTYFISKKEWAAFDIQFSPVEKHASKRRSDINTNIIMLRSLSLKKDKSKNSTYILVNRVRRCSVRRSLSSLFNLLALFGARIGRAPLIVFAMIDDSHARAHDFLFFFLSLSFSLAREHRLRTGYIFKNQIGPETSNLRTESTTTTIEQPLRKMQPRR